MDASKVWIRVCVLAILVVPVTCEFCAEAEACLEDLNFNFGRFTVYDSLLKGVASRVGGPIVSAAVNTLIPGHTLGELCEKKSEATRCYREITNCPRFVLISTALPMDSQVQEALDSICEIKDELQQCKRKVQGLDSFLKAVSGQLSACNSQLDTLNEFARTQSVVNHDTASRMTVEFTSCLAEELRSDCGGRVASKIDAIWIQLIPEHVKNGCLRLGSWPFLGVLAALIASASKRF